MSKDYVRVEADSALFAVVERLGTRAPFCAMVVKYTHDTPTPSARSINETLRAADLSDMAEIFARYLSLKTPLACERELAFLESRADAPEALFAAAEDLVPGKTRGPYDSKDPDMAGGQRLEVRDNLLALGAVRFVFE